MAKYRFLSCGAGVQSSTLAKLASEGLVPHAQPLNAAIFADTQDEPRSVYDWLAYLKGIVTFPIETVTAGRLSQKSLTMRITKDGRRFSSTDIPLFTLSQAGKRGKIRYRSCTRDFKIYPIISFVRHYVGQDLQDWRRTYKVPLKEWREAKKVKRHAAEAWDELQHHALVEQWIGISLDELQRAKPSREPWIRHRHPLIEMRWARRHCLDYWDSLGLPQPTRSACVFCPFHSNAEWLRLKTEEPAAFAAAVEFERKLQAVKGKTQNFSATPFLHRSCQPLVSIDFTSKDDINGQRSLWGDECEGMCGV